MVSNACNFIYTVTPQFWFGCLLSHSYHSRLCPQDDSFKEFYALHNEEDDDSTQHTKFDFPEPHDGHSLVIGSGAGISRLWSLQ
nr:hypothetical protein CFP56_52921 [Quercus suber]